MSWKLLAGASFVAAAALALSLLALGPHDDHRAEGRAAGQAKSPDNFVSLREDPPQGPRAPKGSLDDLPFPFTRAPRESDALPPGFDPGNHLRLRGGASRRIGVGRGRSGAALPVYIGRSTDGQTCLAIVLPDGFGAGCRKSADSFVAEPVFWTSTVDGGPSPSTMSNYVIAGTVASRVKDLAIKDSGGDLHEVPLNADRSFVYVAPDADVQAGDLPQTLVVYGTAGSVISEIAVRGANE